MCITEEELAGFAFEEGEDMREAGERLAASYVNFYIANKSVLVPSVWGRKRREGGEYSGRAFPGSEGGSGVRPPGYCGRRKYSLHHPADPAGKTCDRAGEEE